jgi:tetratricopeptide (TPR) repeat protein
MLETRNINAALEQYVNAANLAPSDPEVWKALILFCITTNTYIEDYGFSALSKLSIFTPNDPQIYYFLGRIQMAQGNYEQAEISFEQAALANIGRPSLEEILFYQGFLYLKTGKEAQSREKLIQLLEEYPDGRYYQQTLDMLQPNVPDLSSKVNLALPKFLANHSFPAFFHSNLSLASTLERVYSPSMVLIQDNFNSSTSIVSTGLAEAGGSEIADGIFKMTITKPDGLMIKSLGQDRLEAEIEVSSYPSDTSNETFSGVVCHMRDAKNYTYLSISSLGKANIGQVVNGKQNFLAIKDNTDGSINLGSMINTIKGVCTAEIAQLSINGQVYLTAELSNAFSGDVGFFAGTTTVAPVVILFDDLTVRIPEPLQ